MRRIQSGHLIQFTEQDFNGASNGMAKLIEVLTKTVKTMNPQDPDRKKLQSGIDELGRLKGQLMQVRDNLSDVNI